MAVPLPTDAEMLLVPPDAAEAEFVVRGFASATSGPAGLTEIQRLLYESLSWALTNHRVDTTALEPVTAAEFAQGLARRNMAFRTRVLQIMVLGELVLNPIPPQVSENVAAFADELGVADDLVGVARSFAAGCAGMAALDFERNGYLAETAHTGSVHASHLLQQPWEATPHDP